MIVYPLNWTIRGLQIRPEEVNNSLATILRNYSCNSLSFSGGIDSSLLLWHMSKLYRTVYAYTIASNDLHPDLIYATQVARLFPNVVHRVYIPDLEAVKREQLAAEEYKGDAAVRLFYKWVSEYTRHIITGDGIDEFMCGYYDHQNDPTEATYYLYQRRLQKEQLLPLDKNSGDVQVYLPYIDDRMVILLSQIPLSEKVDSNQRKKFMYRLLLNKLPESLFERRKRGFINALDDIKEVAHA